MTILEKPGISRIWGGPKLEKTNVCFSWFVVTREPQAMPILEKNSVSSILVAHAENLYLCFDLFVYEVIFWYPGAWRGPSSSACGSLVGLLFSLALWLLCGCPCGSGVLVGSCGFLWVLVGSCGPPPLDRRLFKFVVPYMTF